MYLWSAPATVTRDDEKNAKPAVATDDLIAMETPEKKAEEMNSVEEENKVNSDDSEQAPPPSVTKVTVKWMTGWHICCFQVCFDVHASEHERDPMKADFFFFQILTFLWISTIEMDI